MTGSSASHAQSFELGTDGPTAVIVGVDGSQSSFRAWAYAAGLVRRQSSRLVAVYARPLSASMFVTADRTGVVAQSASRANDEVEAELHALFERFSLEHPHASLVIRGGDALHVIEQVAQEVRADAVVVGASTQLGHRSAGSLAVRLVRAGRWPVTVVP